MNYFYIIDYICIYMLQIILIYATHYILFIVFFNIKVVVSCIEYCL